MSKIKDFYTKHKEIILYIFFGALSTLVDLLVFLGFDLAFQGRLYGLSNFLAWLFATIFAFVVNKLFVFEYKSKSSSAFAKEILEFFVMRALSLVISELGMVLFIEHFGFKSISFQLLNFTITGNLIAKAILSVVVIILNYFFSKFIIFKTKA